MSANMEKIPVFAPDIGVDTLKHLTDALHIGWLGMGAITKEFEYLIAAYLGLEGGYVAATNTSPAAFHLRLCAAGVGSGQTVVEVPAKSILPATHGDIDE